MAVSFFWFLQRKVPFPHLHIPAFSLLILTDISSLHFRGNTLQYKCINIKTKRRRDRFVYYHQTAGAAPLIAKKAKAGQFIIVRAKEDSERIPLTIAGFDREAGTVSIIFQVVGAGTMQLNSLKEGEAVHDFVGPLGKATEIEGLKNVCVVGGGVGCDGSYGEKGVVTAPLEKKIVEGANFDEVITIGPLIMMKFVVKTTKPHGVKTVVSMNPIMVDGTGMCGGCRLTVGGQTKFACVDGPDFDGFEVDFDEAMHRGTMYKPFEAHAREAECNLLKQEVQ